MQQNYLKDYRVLKDFLSHDSKRVYKVGDIYVGGNNSRHTQALLKHGFIKDNALADYSNKPMSRMPKRRSINIEVRG